MFIKILLDTHRILKTIHQTRRELMSAIDNLTANVISLQVAVGTVVDKVTALQAQIGIPAATEAQIQAQADAVAAATDKLNSL